MRVGCLLALGALGLGAVGLFLFFPPGDSFRATGSPEYAAKWREAFTPLADPDAARAKHPEVRAKRFDNGEWIFGVCRDSHRYKDGGTIVVKDSTGKVRAFFGHVCGDEFLKGSLLRRPKSLAEFYDHSAWKQFDFEEYLFQ